MRTLHMTGRTHHFGDAAPMRIVADKIPTSAPSIDQLTPEQATAVREFMQKYRAEEGLTGEQRALIQACGLSTEEFLAHRKVLLSRRGK